MPHETAPLHATRRALLGAGIGLVAAGRAIAQPAWPSRPIRFVVMTPPGPGSDQMARALAGHYQTILGQPVVVENRPGAGGAITAQAVATATDGHTIGLVFGGPTTTARLLNPGLPYDPATAFSSVTLLTRSPFVLAVHPGFPAKTWAEFLAVIRANPGKYRYASIGPGTTTHLAMEETKQRLGLDIEHVPYRGFAPATLDLLAGRVEVMFHSPFSALQHIRAGALVALVQTGDRRVAQMPDVPTLAEAGLPDSAFFGWTGIIAPASFPPAIAERLAVLTREAMARDPAARGGMEETGAEIVGSSPAELAALQARETARWGAVITRLGLTVTD
ncbi:Bug family tripartite tricarboxylate transporter substrate binding protein [Falsiroseomonas stagni]|uniref:Tripartite-type tricarboxylate transporter, receptor component TctC n=1 Tax=Falsiroseomonas stagni DSM 19981 TaxID=1123062 RepID=A0A1I4D4W4_9PROT|nr:tripartite tricarboxylate transporter substrate binding protein [Falsiroseomonas stagni]SFK88562.1 Tripartite-type tricarboxylate transporter, receptor component TctC [Falsiroseomonas stagni DSM 19981]